MIEDFLARPRDTLRYTIVVCTYDRAELLCVCLESLAALDFPKGLYEILVVDNNSRDHTREVVAGFAAAHATVRYVFEAEQGLSAARNRGIREARGVCLAFLDDECKVARDWLSQADRVRRETAAQVFGGPYEPWYQGDKPVWYKDAYGASQDIGPTGWLPDTAFASGGNFFVERRMVEEVDGFRTDLGMKGNQIGYGEETDLQIRIRKQTGSRTYYDKALTVWHCVRPEKLRLLWRIEASWRSGRQNAVMGRAGQPGFGRELLRLPFRLLLLVGGCATATVARNRVQFPYMQNYIYEVVAPQVASLGRSFAVLTGEAWRSRWADGAGGKPGGDVHNHPS